MDGNWLDLCKQFMSHALKTAPVRNYRFGVSTGIILYTNDMKRLVKSYERFLYMAAKWQRNTTERWKWFHTSNICGKHSFIKTKKFLFT
jgi:hypothetical protein